MWINGEKNYNNQLNRIPLSEFDSIFFFFHIHKTTTYEKKSAVENKQGG